MPLLRLPTRPFTDAPRAVQDPAWWLALGLLVVNDHALKGAGLLPGWFTGKLSDVAGLIVAPPVAAWLLRARSRSARAGAGLAVGALFAAINLWPPVAANLVALVSRAGLHWQVWPDPTDLVTLAVLPLGIALAMPARKPVAPWSGRLALIAAAVACLGSSSDDEAGSSGSARSANVENATDETLVVIAASTEGAGGCDLYTEDRVSILTDDAFVHTRALRLEPGDRAAISERGDCAAARLELPDGKDARFYWTGLQELEGFLPPDDAQRLARTAVIEGETDNWRFDLGADLIEYDPDRRPPDSNCPSMDEPPSLEWTPLPIAQGWLDLVDTGPDEEDGCLSISWAPPDDQPASDGGVDDLTQSLCVPAWAFPFDAGDRLSVVEQREGLARSLQVARYREDGALDVELGVFVDATRLEDPAFASLRSVECFGSISACGAYVRPVEVELRDGQLLSAGEEGDLAEGPGRSTQVLIGPAFDVGWAGRSCEGGQASTGVHAGALVLRRF